MKTNRFAILGSLVASLLIAGLLSFSFSNPKGQRKILVFSKTNGFYHTSIPDGVKAIQKLGSENGFACDTTTDSLQFNTRNLKKYAAVVFLNTTLDVLGEKEQEAFKKFIQSGKGFVGIHAAADTEYDWPWYNELVGAYFLSHPDQQQARLVVKDQQFIATSHLPAEWSRWDEWYNFKSTHWDKVHVLMTIDEQSYKGGKNGDSHPMAWYREFDGGRSFYTALGHTEDSYKDPLYLKHLLGGIEYAMKAR